MGCSFLQLLGKSQCLPMEPGVLQSRISGESTVLLFCLREGPWRNEFPGLSGYMKETGGSQTTQQSSAYRELCSEIGSLAFCCYKISFTLRETYSINKYSLGWQYQNWHPWGSNLRLLGTTSYRIKRSLATAPIIPTALNGWYETNSKRIWGSLVFGEKLSKS